MKGDKMNDITNIQWATKWLSATSSDFLFNGESIRRYGKDRFNMLVAVQTDSGTYPVRSLPAVLAHTESIRDRARRGARRAPWQPVAQG